MASNQRNDAAAFPCSITIRIPFPTPRLAHTALRALAVDRELSPLVRRSFTVEDAGLGSYDAEHHDVAKPPAEAATTAVEAVEEEEDAADDERRRPAKQEGSGQRQNQDAAVLVTRYTATTNRMLRVAVNGFFESVRVVLACMRELDVGVVGAAWVGELAGELAGDGDGGGDGDGEVARAVERLERVQGLEEGGVVG